METAQLELPFEAGVLAPPPNVAEARYAWLDSRPVQEHVLDRAVSIRQPWLRIITLGLKWWEFRTQPNGRQGWTIMLHSSQKLERDWRTILRRANAPGDYPGDLGAICAVATLGRCVPLGPKSRDRERNMVPARHPGRPPDTWSGFGWELLDIRRVKPVVPCSGMLGIWHPSEDLQAQVLERVRA